MMNELNNWMLLHVYRLNDMIYGLIVSRYFIWIQCIHRINQPNIQTERKKNLCHSKTIWNESVMNEWLRARKKMKKNWFLKTATISISNQSTPEFSLLVSIHNCTIATNLIQFLFIDVLLWLPCSLQGIRFSF